MVTKKDLGSNRNETETVKMICRFDDINTYGFWVNCTTGEGYRITEDSLKAGHSPVIGYVSNNDQFTLVSSDPYAPISKLRQLTANLDLPVGF
jgi:hypothetical protein